MFEEGARLKAVHGPENVFDFSLGNPDLPPPERFSEVLRDTVNATGLGDHAYMPNTGNPGVCAAVAEYLSREHGVAISDRDVVMTCGAAGGLNIIMKTLLDPEDEVITPAPFFVEYVFYTENHRGVLKTVPTKDDFSLDLGAIASAVTSKTKIVLINSPNNPTGQVYPEEDLKELGALLARKSAETGRTIYLVSDEPYRKIVYDGVQVPSILTCYPNSLVVSSYSKELSIPGERLGYVVINPQAGDLEQLRAGLAFTNRVLGFVNAPALIQRVVGQLQGSTVDAGIYRRKRDLLCEGLADCGYEFVTPPGAFYLFPRSPVADDVEFVRALQKERVLTVPGSGFGGPGYFRIAYCVDEKTITGAIPAFKKVMEKYR